MGARRQAIVATYNRLGTLREVGKECGISGEAVRLHLKAAGIDTSVVNKPKMFRVPGRFRDNPELVTTLENRYREVGSVPKVAREYNLNSEVVYWALRKRGIKFRGIPYEVRFWSKVQRTENDVECWLWIGKARTKCGYYGRMSYEGGKKWLSHHLAWHFTHGERDNDLWVLHDCGHSLCCNPKHLKLGTPQDNADDRIRHASERGEHWWHRRTANFVSPHKLSHELIERIQHLRAQKLSTWKIADMVGVSRKTAWEYSKNIACKS